MRRNLTWAVVLGVAALGVTAYVGDVFATPGAGFTGSTIAKGRFEAFDVMLQSFPEGEQRPWLSMQKTKGPSDLYVQNNVWAPGGTTGWHTHPGHSLIMITHGTVTVYDAEDPTCTPQHFTAGMTFVDHGGDHVHLIRNEQGIEARGVAVQLVPADAVRRIDAARPAACPF